MSVKAYKNGAFQDIETLRRYEDGAWKDCEAAYKHENGTWKEVWRSMGIFSLIALPQYGNGYVPSNQKSMSLMNGDGDTKLALKNSGFLDLRIEGEWVNPMITFDWHGGYTYWNNNFTKGYRNKAGEIKVQAYPPGSLTSGYAGTHSVSVGTYGSWSGEVRDDSGTFSWEVIDNRFNVYGMIRVIVTPTSYETAAYGAFNEISIDNFFISGKQVGFPVELNDFYKEYG